MVYENGFAVKKNPGMALQYYRKLAKESDKAAAIYYQKVVNSGNVDAQERLAKIYEKRVGVRHSKNSCKDWSERVK